MGIPFAMFRVSGVTQVKDVNSKKNWEFNRVTLCLLFYPSGGVLAVPKAETHKWYLDRIPEEVKQALPVTL